MRNWKVQGLALGLMVFVACAVCAAAQTKPDSQQEIKTIVINGGVAIGGADSTQPQGAMVTFVSSEMGFESKVVAGAPYSADAVTEFTQILANGQRIYRKSTSAMYRDSVGRTRREQAIETIGSLGSAAEAKQTIIINDPVANVSYILDPKNHTAVKRTFAAGLAGALTTELIAKIKMVEGSAGGETSVTATALPRKTEAGGIMLTKVDSANVRKESLGTQMISGVQAEGTRITETIPAGAIGNDTPIDIISESWVSTELGVVVKTVHNDPRSGENVYELTNIRRGEPSAALFQVPADYTVTDNPASEKMMQIIKKDGK